MKSRKSLKNGSCWVKTRSLGQMLEKPCVCSGGHIFSLIKMFVLMKSCTNLGMGHVGSKTRSPGHTLEKACVQFRGHISGPIIMKLVQNVCLDEILEEFKKWVMSGKELGHLVRCKKNLVYALKATFSVK